MLVDKFNMRLGIIGADSQDDDVAALILGVSIAKSLCFFGATGGIVAGVKVEDNTLSAKLAEADGVALCVGEAEVGCSIAGGKSHGNEKLKIGFSAESLSQLIRVAE